MRIGLYGYGKMGRAIEALAVEQGVEIAWRITRENAEDVNEELLHRADLVIEFTRPDAAFENVMRCLRVGLPVVSGTTGWSDRLPEAENYCRETGGAFLWASNFSIGVNLLFAVNRYLADLMRFRPEYTPAITEMHHIHKLDAPSGTAVTLANDLISRHPAKNGWKLSTDSPADGDIPITSIRENEVPGTHIITWSSAIDTLSLHHEAHTRTGFAQGALLAAAWLKGKQGVYRMQDVLSLENIR